jgi:hypothetical protein
VSRPDDHFGEMPAVWFTDDVVEAVMRGDDLDGPLDGVAAFGREVQALAERPPVPPSPALAVMFARGTTTEPHRGNGIARSEKPSTAQPKPRSRRLVVKVAMGATAITLGAAGAAAAGVLPDRATSALRDAVDVVVPVDIDDAPQPDVPVGETPEVTEPDPSVPSTEADADPDARPPDTNPDPEPAADDSDKHDDGPDPDPDAGGGKSRPKAELDPEPEPDPEDRVPDVDPGGERGRGKPDADPDPGGGKP